MCQLVAFDLVENFQNWSQSSQTLLLLLYQLSFCNILNALLSFQQGYSIFTRNRLHFRTPQSLFILKKRLPWSSVISRQGSPSHLQAPSLILARLLCVCSYSRNIKDPWSQVTIAIVILKEFEILRELPQYDTEMWMQSSKMKPVRNPASSPRSVCHVKRTPSSPQGSPPSFQTCHLLWNMHCVCAKHSLGHRC